MSFNIAPNFRWYIYCDQNNSYEITINGFQDRKINQIRNVSYFVYFSWKPFIVNNYYFDHSEQSAFLQTFRYIYFNIDSIFSINGIYTAMIHDHLKNNGFTYVYSYKKFDI